MTNRTVISATYEAYLADQYARPVEADAVAVDRQGRQIRLAQFPHSIVLQVAFPELDFANRWCWQQFGPADGQCYDASSEYRTCSAQVAHSHQGQWTSQWLAKTSYDFGYNEWYFALKEDHQRFIEFIPQIHWGEGWPR